MEDKKTFGIFTSNYPNSSKVLTYKINLKNTDELIKNDSYKKALKNYRFVEIRELKN